MDTPNELEQQFVRFRAEVGQILTANDINRMADAPLTTLLSLLSLLFWDQANGRPLSGVPHDTLTTPQLLATATGDLDWSLSSGFGLLWDTSTSPDPFRPTRYQPIVLAAAETGTLDAHDATNPRIDLLCIAPATATDESEARNVKDPETGLVDSSSIDARKYATATVQVVTGTPATNPTVPATPAGHLPLAHAYVPASSGAAEWVDVRPVLELTLGKGTSRLNTDDFVVRGQDADELEVLALSTPALGVRVERGRACINGVVRQYPRQKIPLTTADPTNPRIDLVVALEDGTIDVVDGTPGVTPTVPSSPSNAVPLGEVEVAAAATVITDTEITDRRERQPLNGNNHIKVESMNHNRLETPEVFVQLTPGTPSGGLCSIAVELFYPDGVTPYEGPFNGPLTPAGCAFEAEVFVYDVDAAIPTSSYTAGYQAAFEADFTATDIATGVLNSSDPSAVTLWFKPDSANADNYNQQAAEVTVWKGRTVFWMRERTGTLRAKIADAGTGTIWLLVRPINRPGGCSPNCIIEYS